MNNKFLLILALSAGLSVFTPAANKHNIAFAEDIPAGAYPDFSVMAERLLPTVVNVSTKTKINRKNFQFQNGQIPDEILKNFGPFKDLFEQFGDQLQQQYGYNNAPENEESEKSDKPYATPESEVSALGSGFVIDAQKGYIVTNNHVIDGADEIQVILNDKTTVDASLVGKDEKTDIALLQVKDSKEKLVATTWGNSDQLKVGNWVLAIGNPFGLGGTVTAGIVSARERDINSGPYDDYIQTDASINRGNSGGPMFNTKGEVVGVNTAIFSTMGGGSIGIGFAVPANMVKEVVDQIIQYGSTKRGWIGVNIQPVTDEMAESLELPKAEGAMVAGVTPEGPSAKAGIEVGDIILEFDGKKINEMRNLPKLVASTEVGKEVDMTILRKGERKTVKVALGQLEKAEKDGLIEKAEKSSPAKDKKQDNGSDVKELGLKLSAQTELLKKQFRLEKDAAKGVMVLDVAADSTAADKGIRPGDIIVSFEQENVTAPEQVSKLLDTAKAKGKTSVLLFVSRGEDKRFIALKLKDKDENKTEKK